MPRKVDVETFIGRARKLFGRRYDYSESVYLGHHRPLKIKCGVHGPFMKSPSNHLKGQGCRRCGLRKVANADDFKEEARKIHGNRYNYDKVKYTKSQSKVIVTCAIHGDFPVSPNSHLSSRSGCPNCFDPTEQRQSTIEIKERIYEIFGKARYDLTRLFYVNPRTKICIICPKEGHGESWVNPINVLYKNGAQELCSQCSGRKVRNQETFLKRACEIHGDLYDFSEFKYINAKTKGKIFCKKHENYFHVTPDNLINKGVGCPLCSYMLHPFKSRGVDKLNGKNRDGYLYVLKLSGGKEVFYKIGVSLKKEIKKGRYYKSNMPYKIEILALIKDDWKKIIEFEVKVLSDIAKFYYKPKISFGGHTECFSVNPLEFHVELKNKQAANGVA